MLICICHAISEKTIREHVSRGVCNIRQLSSVCGAGSDCGSCVPKLQKLLRERYSSPSASQRKERESPREE